MSKRYFQRGLATLSIYTTAQGLMSQIEEEGEWRNIIHKIVRHGFILWEYGL